MTPFGSLPQVQAMVSKLSVPELVQIAQTPPSGDPTAQYAATAELANRQRAKAAPQQPQSTVVEDMANQAMAMPRPQGPGDPIGQGAATLNQQQGIMPQPQQAPEGMKDGGAIKMETGGGISGGTGEIMDNLPGIMDSLRQYYHTDPLDAEHARSMVDQFRGQDYLTPMLATLKDRDAQAQRDRRQNLWLALARGGFTAAGTPGGWGRALGAGGLAGIDAAQHALSGYNDAISHNDDRRANIETALQGRDDRFGAAGLDAMLQSRRDSRAGDRAMVDSASGIARLGSSIDEGRADRAAANWRDSNDVSVLADQLYQANGDHEHQVPMTGPDGQPLNDSNGRPITVSVPYTHDDAMNDAISMLGGGRGRGRGAAPDDLTETLRAAIFMADPTHGFSAEEQASAREIVSGITSGSIGNAGSTTRRGAGIATDTRAASETGDAPTLTPEQIARARAGAANYTPSGATPRTTRLDANNNVVGHR